MQPTLTGDYVRDAVHGRNMGLDQITGRVATDGQWCHRLSAGRGGPRVVPNGLWLAAPVHQATHNAPALSYRAGWFVETSAEAAAVPALIRSPLAPMGGWHWLDGTQGDGLACLVEPWELGAAADAGRIDPTLTLAEALHQLRTITGLAA